MRDPAVAAPHLRAKSDKWAAVAAVRQSADRSVGYRCAMETDGSALQLRPGARAVNSSCCCCCGDPVVRGGVKLIGAVLCCPGGCVSTVQDADMAEEARHLQRGVQGARAAAAAFWCRDWSRYVIHRGCGEFCSEYYSFFFLREYRSGIIQ